MVEQPGENKFDAAHVQAPAGENKPNAPHEPAAQTTGVSPTVFGRGLVDPNSGTNDEAKIRPTYADPPGLAAGVGAGNHGEVHYAQLTEAERQNVYTFFSIYFMMTGLHGVHVVVGMGLIAWIFFRSTRNEFGPTYFTPVDLVGLYWHLVDLIWIFLFPLLYLIH